MIGIQLAPDVSEYLQRKGWAWKNSGGQCEMLCPICGHGDGKDNRFRMSPSTGCWTCFHCGEKGNLWTIKRLLGDLVLTGGKSCDSAGNKPRALKGAPQKKKPDEKRPDAGMLEAEVASLHSPAGASTLAYLTGVRGLTLATIQKFKLGHARKAVRLDWPVHDVDGNVVKENGKAKTESRVEAVDLVSVPSFVGGAHVNTKYRPVPPAPKSFRRVQGCASTLFNVDSLIPGDDTAAIVVEGEFDVMAAEQLGFENVVSGSTGAKGWDEEWLDSLDGFGAIYLCFDTDEAGDEGAERLAVALGKHRCYRVVLPLKDMNDCVAAGMTADDVGALFDEARAYELRELVHVDTFRSRLERARAHPETTTGRTWGWVSLDKLLGGLRDELIIVTGDTGSGKSTFVNNVCWRQAVLGFGTAVFSFENNPEDVSNAFLSMEAGGDALTITDARFKAAADAIAKRPLYLYDYSGEIELDKLEDSIQYAVRRKGSRLVVLDHLHYFLAIDDPRYERQIIEKAMKRIALWPKKFKVPIVLVIHPSQTENDNEKVGMNKLRGASAIKQAGETILRVWRKRTDDRKQSGKPTGWITSLKVRSRYGVEGSAVLLYDPASSQFFDDDERKETGDE